MDTCTQYTVVESQTRISFVIFQAQQIPCALVWWIFPGWKTKDRINRTRDVAIEIYTRKKKQQKHFVCFHNTSLFLEYFFQLWIFLQLVSLFQCIIHIHRRSLDLLFSKITAFFFSSKLKERKKNHHYLYDDLKIISFISIFPLLPASRVTSRCGLYINDATVSNVLRKGHHYANSSYFSSHYYDSCLESRIMLTGCRIDND